MDRTMLFPVGVRVAESAGAVGVLVPDVPESAGSCPSLQEALVFARNAIERHIEAVLERRRTGLEAPRSVESLAREPLYRDFVWVMVPIDIGELYQRHARRLRTAAFERFSHRSRGALGGVSATDPHEPQE